MIHAVSAPSLLACPAAQTSRPAPDFVLPDASGKHTV